MKKVVIQMKLKIDDTWRTKMWNAFFLALTIVLITLRLTGYSDWSWWLILLPIYGGIVIVLVMLMLAGILLSVAQRRKQWITQRG